MGYAAARINGNRIVVQTVRTRGVDDFDFMLSASKKVNGGSFERSPHFGAYWHYPLSMETCQALRRAFGKHLRVGDELADWYTAQAQEAAQRGELAAATETKLKRVPKSFATWLRGYQRVGARWIAEGYRGSGLVGDEPGLGKTPETLAALLEANVQGPVLVVCPKASVKSVWGHETRRHLKGVPVYLCAGNRERRERILRRFAIHMKKEPNRLRIVVVVAEMLRVELGNPCYTIAGIEFNEAGHEVEVPKNKVSGMCPAHRRVQKCTRHIQVPPPETATKSQIKKWLVPVGFQYSQLFDVKLLSGGWSWIILDEAHKLLGSLTVTKANLMGRALKLLPERGDGTHERRRYALTGTPFGKGGRAHGIFGTLHWLWPDEYTSFWKWAREVFDTEEQVIGYDKSTRTQKTATKIVGPKGMAEDATLEEEKMAWEAFLSSLGPRVLRRTKREMLKDLPPKTYREVICELTAAQRKQLEELITYAEITTRNGIIMANGHLPLLTRSQQIANGALTKGKEGKAQFTQDSGKLDRLWEMLDARGIIDSQPGDKLVIASRYNEFLDAIAHMLSKDKVKHLRLDGSVSEEQKQFLMNVWQTNKCYERVMLVNVKAAGISINLDAADEMHVMDEDPDPGVNTQLEDRIHRASRDHKVIIYYYRTLGTVDYEAANNVEFRRRVQHEIMDGRRGIDYARELLKDALEGAS